VKTFIMVWASEVARRLKIRSGYSCPSGGHNHNKSVVAGVLGGKLELIDALIVIQPLSKVYRGNKRLKSSKPQLLF